MNFYEKELKSIEKVNRLRQRKIFGEDLTDMASNDYLGLSQNKKIAKKAFKMIRKYKYASPKASMLVNGYHPIHKKFETLLCKVNKFESAIVVGSGFLANIALIESLVRKKDLLLIDKEYHASGNLASKLIQGDLAVFDHNDTQHLEQLILKNLKKYDRIIVAIEGVYSMSGDIAPKQFAEIANKYKVILIVDEAHSSGVIGENLLGWFDYHSIEILPNHIKMGTLGKAYGSYGAYILASNHIVNYLENRAKPIIYSTAPSLYETAFGYFALKHIQKHKNSLKEKIANIQKIAFEQSGLKTNSLILPIVIDDNAKVLQLQQQLLGQNILVGAIRQPTVSKAILRIILRIDTQEQISSLFAILKLNNVQKFTNLIRSGFYAKAHELLEEDWKYFRKTGLKELELFYKGVINAATALALIQLKRRKEAVQKTWDCYNRYKVYKKSVESDLQKDFSIVMELLEELYETSTKVSLK